MNGKEILVEWLQSNGYDGLYDDCDGCFCLIADLMPCNDCPDMCQAGYIIANGIGREQ